MKKTIAFVLALALAACGVKNPEYVQAPQVAQPAQPQVVYQQAPQAQQDTGPGWGGVAAGVIGGAVLGHLLTNKAPDQRAVVVQDTRVYQDNSDRRRSIFTAPKPNTITTAETPAPKPSLVAPVTPKPSFAPAPSAYTQKQSTPTYTAPPKSYSVPSTSSYKSSWSSSTSRSGRR